MNGKKGKLQEKKTESAIKRVKILATTHVNLNKSLRRRREKDTGMRMQEAKNKVEKKMSIYFFPSFFRIVFGSEKGSSNKEWSILFFSSYLVQPTPHRLTIFSLTKRGL